MPNPFAGPKIALLCSIFYEYMIPTKYYAWLYSDKNI